MSADWAITLIEHANAKDILGWNFESPLAGSEAGGADSDYKVRFRGWFLAPGGPGRITLSQGGTVLVEEAADTLRPDVARARIADPAARQSMERCGFDISVPRGLGPFRLQVQTAPQPGLPQAMMAFDILDRNGGPYALLGSHRQLFLGGDTNDSVGQFTQSRSLPDGSFRSWQANFAAMRNWETSMGLRMGFLVAPAKEEVYTDCYPFPRAERTLLDDFRRRFIDGGAVVPLHELRAQRQFAYCETDTHWTDYGATIAARAMLKSWGMQGAADAGLPQAFCVRQRQGDLGVKLTPRRANYEMMFGENPDATLVFDNGVRNQGCMRVWDNPVAPVKSGCLVFGDSFGTNFAQALAGVFARVTYVYRPAGFDAGLAAILKPGHVILQITQRFLHGSPDRRSSLFETAATKIAALPECERAVAVAGLAKAALGPFAPLSQPVLDLLSSGE